MGGDAVRRALVAGAFGVAFACAGAKVTAQELPMLGGASEAEESAAPAPGSVEPEASPEQDRALAERLRQVFGAVEGLDAVAVEVRACS